MCLVELSMKKVYNPEVRSSGKLLQTPLFLKCMGDWKDHIHKIILKGKMCSLIDFS